MAGFSIAALASLAASMGAGIKNVIDSKARLNNENSSYAREQANIAAMENENPQDRSDVRATMALKQRNDLATEQRMTNTGRMMGSTNEARTALAEKEMNSSANLATNIAAQQQQRKDRAKAQRINSDARHQSRLDKLKADEINSDLNLGTNALQVAEAGINGINEGFGKDKTAPVSEVEASETAAEIAKRNAANAAGSAFNVKAPKYNDSIVNPLDKTMDNEISKMNADGNGISADSPFYDLARKRYQVAKRGF